MKIPVRHLKEDLENRTNSMSSRLCPFLEVEIRKMLFLFFNFDLAKFWGAGRCRYQIFGTEYRSQSQAFFLTHQKTIVLSAAEMQVYFFIDQIHLLKSILARYPDIFWYRVPEIWYRVPISDWYRQRPPPKFCIPILCFIF